MKQWVTTRCRADLSKVAARYNISETFAEVLVKRGLYDWASMDGYLFDDMVSIPKASEMLGLCEAADLIEQKLSQGKKIHIVGDYDVDGVMSTYILSWIAQFRGRCQLSASTSPKRWLWDPRLYGH